MGRNIGLSNQLAGSNDCSFCGKDTSIQGGHWIGVSRVNCCPKCAVGVLPKLLADSLDYGETIAGKYEAGWKMSYAVEDAKAAIDAAIDLNFMLMDRHKEETLCAFKDSKENRNFLSPKRDGGAA